MKYLLSLLFSWLFFTGLRGQELYFPPLVGTEWATTSLAEAGFGCGDEQALYDYLETTNTDAFLLLKDGKIVMERYFGDFTESSPHLWNSAGKTMTATAVGIAATLGLLDLDEPVSNYLGVGWTSCPDTEARITIRHLLTMTSGLNDGTGDVSCTAPECLICLAEPGQRWAYHNGPYTLLTEVITAATGQTMNEFVTERIKRPTGMSGLYLTLGDNRVFTSNARSMARFGLLTLGQGSWATTPVLTDTTYLRQMTTPSQTLNEAYGYLWWLNGQTSYRLPGSQFNFPGLLVPDAPADAFAGIGKDNQLVYVVPSENLVMVRMGEATDGTSNLVPTIYSNEIWNRINALRCATSTDPLPTTLIPSLTVSPNPAGGWVRVSAEQAIRYITAFAAGRLLHNWPGNGQTMTLETAALPAGVVSLRVVLTDGTVSWRRVVIH